jgi:hypothetical protein
MRSGGWDYDIRARCALPDAVALLSDLTRQGELHPLIIEVKELPPVEGALRSYAITDRLAMGPVRFTITYTADTLSVTDHEIVTVAHQKPRTTIRNRTTFTEEPDGVVLIAVHVELEAPSLLLPFAQKEGHKAHLALAERIKTVLERS